MRRKSAISSFTNIHEGCMRFQNRPKMVGHWLCNVYQILLEKHTSNSDRTEIVL